jgi:hypothetical protein
MEGGGDCEAGRHLWSHGCGTLSCPSSDAARPREHPTKVIYGKMAGLHATTAFSGSDNEGFQLGYNRGSIGNIFIGSSGRQGRSSPTGPHGFKADQPRMRQNSPHSDQSHSLRFLSAEIPTSLLAATFSTRSKRDGLIRLRESPSSAWEEWGAPPYHPIPLGC